MSEELKAGAEEKSTSTRGRAKTRIGVVTSNKMNKTVVVRVERRVRHPKYGKYVLEAVKYKAHVENHDYPANPTIAEGDMVRISETRPLSKDKRWRVVETLRKSGQA